MNISKAVILTAGLGTRFLPVAKSIPKVMLPVLDTPLIHYAVEEVVSAGVEHVIFVISDGQECIRNYFAGSPDLEHILENRDNLEMLERVRSIPTPENVSYVFQHNQLGIGDAVMKAREIVGDDPFALIFPDDLIRSESPTIGIMGRLFDRFGGNFVALREVPNEIVSSLGIVDAHPIDKDVYEISRMVEKPALKNAPSNLAIVGRYILLPTIFDVIENTPPGVGGEIQLTDALSRVLRSEKIYGYNFQGDHFDVGNPLGLLNASIHAASLKGESSAKFGNRGVK